MVKHEVEAGEVEGPTGLSLVELFGHHEILQAFVISPYLEQVFCTFNEMSPLLQ